MRTEFDFSPLFRLERRVRPDVRPAAARNRVAGGARTPYPPYDIERTGEDSYRVTLAVAGFRPERSNVAAQQNLLVVSGDRRQPG